MTFRDWLDAYGTAVNGRPTRCPNCGKVGLVVRLVADPGSRIGYAVCWCPSCLTGVHLSRVRAPALATLIDISSHKPLDGVPDNISFVEP
jgi:hypothetical protein